MDLIPIESDVEASEVPTIFTSLDLELNQPSGKIIQIGAAIGHLMTGEIIEKLSCFIKIDEALDERIIKLTGITESDLASGVSLEEGYVQLSAIHLKHKAFMNPIVWGGGDSIAVRRELEEKDQDFFKERAFCFGRRWIDIKTIYQMYRFANGLKMQSGLSKSLGRLGLQFKGKKHNALDDATNTFFLASKLIERLKNQGDASDGGAP
ncbi:MAG: exonuclease domain-containing protein [Deltaproteobacteria bacterium]|nr:exonuclease domain-containing protein [Deltaproteobacteria bacterium]